MRNIMLVLAVMLLLSSLSFAWLNTSYNQLYKVGFCNPNTYALGNSTTAYRTYIDILNTTPIRGTNSTDILPYLNSTGTRLEFNSNNMSYASNAMWGRLWINFYGIPASSCDYVDIYHNSSSAPNMSDPTTVNASRSFWLNWTTKEMVSGALQGVGSSYNGSVLCAVNTSRWLFYSVDYGATWTPILKNINPAQWGLDCAVSGNGQYIAFPSRNNVTTNVYMFNVTDSTFWAGDKAGDFDSVSMSYDGSFVLSCELAGTQNCIRSQNYGKNYAIADAAANTHYQTAISLNGTWISTAINSGNVRNSNDGGATWNSIAVTGNTRSVTVSDSGKVQYVAGTGAGIRRSMDYGATYSAGVGAFTIYRGLATSHDGVITVAGDDIVNVWISFDLGETWSNISQITTNGFSVDMSRDGRVITVSNLTNVSTMNDIRQMNYSDVFLCPTISLNYTIYDSTTSGVIPASYTNHFSTLTGSSTLSGTANNYSICIYPLNTTPMNTTESYSATNYYPKTIVRSITATNVTQNISVYLLNSTLGTPVTITVSDSTSTKLGGVYINITERSALTNELIPISTKLTNNLGQAVEYLIPVSTLYTFTVYSADGTVLLTQADTAVCTTTNAGEACQLSLIVGRSTGTSYLIQNQVSDYCSFSNLTMILNCTLFGNNNSFVSINLTLQNITMFSGEIYNQTSNTSGNTVYLTVPNQTGTYLYKFMVSNVTADRNVTVRDAYIKMLDTNFIIVNAPQINRFNTDGWFMAWILMISMGFVGFSVGISVGLLLTGIALIMSLLIGLMTWSIPTIVGLMVIIGALIYRVGQTRRE